MAPGGSPKRLSDVTHLFLSQKKGSDPALHRAHTEAVLWIASGGGMVRAFFTSGIGRALVSLGLHVSLVEIWRGLPNIGYYFGLDPAVYLAPALDETAVVEGTYGKALRFICVVEPQHITVHRRAAPVPGFPHVIVTAFSLPDGPLQEERITRLRRYTAAASARDGSDFPPDGILIVDTVRHAPDSVLSMLKARFPDAIMFANGMVTEPDVETVTMPPALERQLARRNPPEGAFFEGLAASFLQRLSYQRKRRMPHAAD